MLPSGQDNIVLVEILEDEFKKPYSEIVLTDLNNFDIGALHLYKVIPEDNIDESFKKIICDMTDRTAYEDIFVTDLYQKDGENRLDKIKLSNVLKDDNDNPILQELLKKDVALGNLGQEIDALRISVIYGDIAFKPINGIVPSDALRFNKSGNTYTLTATGGTHYLTKNAGVWLLVGYDASGFSADGRPSVYTENKITQGDLRYNGGMVAEKFYKATIRQLIDVGLVKSANEKIMSWTLEQVLNAANIVG